MTNHTEVLRAALTDAKEALADAHGMLSDPNAYEHTPHRAIAFCHCTVASAYRHAKEALRSTAPCDPQYTCVKCGNPTWWKVCIDCRNKELTQPPQAANPGV